MSTPAPEQELREVIARTIEDSKTQGLGINAQADAVLAALAALVPDGIPAAVERYKREVIDQAAYTRSYGLQHTLTAMAESSRVHSAERDLLALVAVARPGVSADQIERGLAAWDREFQAQPVYQPTDEHERQKRRRAIVRAILTAALTPEQPS